MALVNEHFLKLSNNYLFADIAKKVNAFKMTHPQVRVISLGIGDVTQPLCPAVIEAMHKAVDEMAEKATFHGYGPERGYDFLRSAIVKNDFAPRGIHLDPSEIFINDGAKSDTGNIGEIVRWDNSIGVTDPIYPVYIDSNVMCGRAGVLENGRWSNVNYMPCTDENDFVPQIPDHRVDMIYLCYPNNPTGTVLPKEELRKWVKYALENDTLILYDAAYEAYIQDDDIPHSIYEIRGAKKCAIEFHSYSKTAGFTGVRCGYTVIPKEVTAVTLDGSRRVELNHLSGPPAEHQVQRHVIHKPACGRSHIHPGRKEAGESHHRLLHGQRGDNAQGTHRHGLQGVWRQERALSVGEDAQRHRLVEVLRADALHRGSGLHARRGLRSQRRRLCAPHRLRQP